MNWPIFFVQRYECVCVEFSRRYLGIFFVYLVYGLELGLALGLVRSALMFYRFDN